MKIMKGNFHNFLLFVILTLLVASCTKNRKQTEEISPKSELVSKIRKEVFVELIVEDDLRPCGTGAQMMDEIKMLGFWFNYYHEIDVDDARKLAMKASDIALSKINNCEEIRPYLVQYPFKQENVEIVIIIRSPNGFELSPEKLQIISVREGILQYENHNLVKDSRRFLSIMHQETYEEALAKLKQDESMDTTLTDPIKL